MTKLNMAELISKFNLVVHLNMVNRPIINLSLNYCKIILAQFFIILLSL